MRLRPMRDPLVCVTVTGRTMDEVRRARDAAAHADLVEVRLDGVDQPDAAGAVAGRHRPVIVTCRAAWEGGAFQGSEEARERILTDAQSAGAEYIDVEARAAFAPAIVGRRRGRGVVLSLHDFDGVPEDLVARAQAMRETGAEVIKLAVAAGRLADTAAVMALADQPPFSESGEIDGHVLLAMGQAGIPTRILAARLRNRWTYAGDAIAPGQMPAERLINTFRFRRIRADAALYGVVGNPIAHSLSPVMHNAGFAALGLNATYVPLEAADADDFTTFARAVGMRGASITAPFKVAIFDRLDETDPLARRVGAVNTLVVRDGRWIGSNSDVEGFLAPLAGRMALKGTRAAVLGAGGAARAVAVALVTQGARVAVCARRPGAAAEVARFAEAAVGTWPPAPGSWDVLVNATSAGSRGPDDDPMAGVALDGEIVFDLVYAPAETPLIRHARAAGCLTIGGLEMLVAQAERQFELWTGQRPPAGLFAAAADHATDHAGRPEPPPAAGEIQ